MAGGGGEENTARIASPELVIGIVAPVGTPLGLFISELRSQLEAYGYPSQVLHLSRLTETFDLGVPIPEPNANEGTRIRQMMQRGDELRRQSGENDILARCAVAEIARLKEETTTLHGTKTIILRQLKRAEEVYLLRRVYREGFHLAGLYTPKGFRQQALVSHHGLTPEEAIETIVRDEHDPTPHGQDLIAAFHLADVFFDLGRAERFRADLQRWIELLFSASVHSPTLEEFGMFQAHGAAVRSAQLSRQVGAAILSKRGEVLAVGTNEVPCAGGGQYWPHHGSQDQRDHVLGYDSNDKESLRIVEEILERLDQAWGTLGQNERLEGLQAALAKLTGCRVLNLTEFGRAVHAEMEAILAAARLGVSIAGATLFTTTFPCHNCTKHIVGAGLKEVVFIEPYPKSLGQELHADAVAVEVEAQGKVRFRPFVGVAPHRYVDLFSMRDAEGQAIRRKDNFGKLRTLVPNLRLKTAPQSFIESEREIVRAIREAGLRKEGQNGEQGV